MLSHDRPAERLPVLEHPLDRHGCLGLLGTVSLGRVGLSADALPVIVPVGFTLVGERLVFRAQIDSQAVAALDGVVVAFEADHWDATSETGWSVLVQGPARRVADRSELGLLGAGVASVWSSARNLVVVDTDVVRGFRLVSAGSLVGSGSEPSTTDGLVTLF